MTVSAWTGTVWLAVLVFLYPIPHTIALRNLLLAGGIVALATAYRPGWRELSRRCAGLKPAAALLAALTLWIFVQSAFISPFRDHALGMIWGGWLMPIVTMVVGLLAAARLPERSALTAVTLALSAHIVLVVGWNGLQMVMPGVASGSVPFAERDYQSLINNFLLALLLGDRLCRHLGRHPMLALPSGMAWFLLSLSFLGDALLRTRNGTLVSLLLVGVALTLSLRKAAPRKGLLLATSSLFAIAALIGSTVALDTRWSGFVESATIGLQSESLYWATPDAPRPIPASGASLEESAYMRAAWARQAVEAIARHPLGLGFGHQAFGWAIDMKYGVKNMESSHSGWLDFALANGWPGLALWLALSGWLIAAGWRCFAREGNGAGLLLAFLATAYLSRCLVDGHLSGWRLALYALLIGILFCTRTDATQTTTEDLTIR